MQVQYEKPTKKTSFKERYNVIFLLILLFYFIFLARKKGVTLEFIRNLDLSLWTLLIAPAAALIILSILLRNSGWGIADRNTRISIDQDLGWNSRERVRETSKIMPIFGLSIWNYILFCIVISGLGIFAVENLSTNQNPVLGGLSLFAMALLLYGSRIYRK